MGTASLVQLEGKSGFYAPKTIQIKLLPEMIHKIGAKKATDLEGRKITLDAYQVESSAWDIVGRVLGMSYKNPRVKHDDGETIVYEVTAEYYNEYGQLISDTTEYQIDCSAVYQKMRLDWRPKREWDAASRSYSGKFSNPNHSEYPKQAVTYSPEGEPIIKTVLPEDAEIELYSNYLTLIRNRHKKAETCCRRSLVQRAVGKKVASIRPGDTNPCIDVVRFIPVTNQEEANAALNQLIGHDDDIIEIKEEDAIEGSDMNEHVGIDDSNCSACKCEIAEEAVAPYSLRKYGRVLCRDCQKSVRV